VTLNHTDILENILGVEVLKQAWRSLVAAVQPQINSMFTRYSQVSELTCLEHSFFLSVSAPADDPLFDMAEQQSVLIPLGQRYLREMLITHFGGGSGRKVDFSLAYVGVDDKAFTDVTLIASLLAEHGVSDSVLMAETNKETCPHSQIERGEFVRILAAQELQTYVQSIRDLQDNSIAGYEVLTRGPKGSVVERADKLFSAASHFGLTQEIEFACAKQALSYLPLMPKATFLTVNLGPDVLSSDELFALVQREEVQPFLGQLAFELTEHLPLDDLVQVTSAVARLRKMGIDVLLDDTGCGFFDISTAEVLHPAIVKLCITVIRRIELGNVIEQEIKATRQRLDKLNTKTLGEGVEEAFQVAALKRAGVQYAQGYFFDRPRPIAEILVEHE
jgi:EAL domain-containing protein (putative c-di-GMP-specific phosphodiesterase class I)